MEEEEKAKNDEKREIKIRPKREESGPDADPQTSEPRRPPLGR